MTNINIAVVRMSKSTYEGLTSERFNVGMRTKGMLIAPDAFDADYIAFVDEASNDFLGVHKIENTWSFGRSQDGFLEMAFGFDKGALGTLFDKPSRISDGHGGYRSKDGRASLNVVKIGGKVADVSSIFTEAGK